MKKAYSAYQLTKELISIRSIASRNRDALTILQSEEFKTLERIVTNEELPITLFLTNICKTINSTAIATSSVFLVQEIGDMFNLVATRDQLALIFRS